ncbi:uncharacterized protein CC84DRAFT_201427 [Paraphaeosphaeria sporulosa]|uniref:Uncharacterized protein n=1 Tax=Paraphaeosphaeria sporulosa TaxID=1460663 RepID=A0A177C4H2_9PLEO|nr:uncharacterized protein CC84DRAFT_201427 [Paraphaeosphaeria sporulosa]OAG01570.1 hypothetical protein CC84DRAFT_201427 [Paraphaeosphaeria sporulosa]
MQVPAETAPCPRRQPSCPLVARKRCLRRSMQCTAADPCCVPPPSPFHRATMFLESRQETFQHTLDSRAPCNKAQLFRAVERIENQISHPCKIVRLRLIAAVIVFLLSDPLASSNAQARVFQQPVHALPTALNQEEHQFSAWTFIYLTHRPRIGDRLPGSWSSLHGFSAEAHSNVRSCRNLPRRPIYIPLADA